jgi:1-acyl-sn-glycerol-3-phosphate acyltransferase
MNIHYLVALIIIGITRLMAGANARWINCSPKDVQRIYYANHSSHLDTVVLWSALPSEIRRLIKPVAAKDYWGKTPIRRYFAKKVYNSVLIDRSGKDNEKSNPIDDILKAMGNKYSIIIFPEGTRGQGEEISTFKSGLYHLAKNKPQVELVPVYMENLSRILPKGELLPVPFLSRITFGAPIKLIQGEQKEEFLLRAKNAVEVLKK